MKLRTSSTRWSSFCDDQMPVTGLIMVKNAMKIADISIFGHYLAPYRHLIITKPSPSCRGGSKLRNEWSNIKISQELASEMRKI